MRGCMDDEVCIGNVLDEIGPKTPSNKSTITLSSDKKNILSDSKIIFSIDDDVIYDFMIGQAGLCDSSNIDNNSSRREYCSDIATYKDMTSFKFIDVSPDHTSLVFEVASQALEPDSAL